MQQWHKRPRPKSAATSRKQEDIQQDRQEDFWTGSREESSHDFHRVTGSERLDSVDGSASSEMKEEAISSLRNRDA
jgi:hypothetical protein